MMSMNSAKAQVRHQALVRTVSVSGAPDENEVDLQRETLRREALQPGALQREALQQEGQQQLGLALVEQWELCQS
jgi:hypothetical protein